MAAPIGPPPPPPPRRPSLVRPGFGVALWLVLGMVVGFALDHVIWGAVGGLLVGLLDLLRRLRA